MAEPKAAQAGASSTPPISSTDAAWVTVPTALEPARLYELCRDYEAIFRVNPYLVFSRWTRTGADSAHVELENLSNNQQLSLDLTVEGTPPQRVIVRYAQGIKRETVFAIEATDTGSRLTIADDYGHLNEDEKRERETEVDRSLQAWGEALFTYFGRQRRWRWLPGWRWYMRRVWIPMKPAARRIVYILCWITVAEFVFFLFVLAIWLIEHRSG